MLWMMCLPLMLLLQLSDSYFIYQNVKKKTRFSRALALLGDVGQPFGLHFGVMSSSSTTLESPLLPFTNLSCLFLSCVLDFSNWHRQLSRILAFIDVFSAFLPFLLSPKSSFMITGCFFEVRLDKGLLKLVFLFPLALWLSLLFFQLKLTKVNCGTLVFSHSMIFLVQIIWAFSLSALPFSLSVFQLLTLPLPEGEHHRWHRLDIPPCCYWQM